MSLDQREQLVLERVHLPGELAEVHDLFACDPDPRARLDSAQPSVDPVELASVGERSALQRRLEVRVERDEMPPQPVLNSSALGDEIVAVISDQPDLHRLLVEKRSREALHTVLDDRAGDRERIDLVWPIPGRGGTEVVSCRGTKGFCRARLSIAGQPRNRERIIRLPARNLWLTSVTAVPSAVNGTYQLSDGHFARNRSELVEILTAIQPEPPGSHLILTFRAFPGT